MKNAKCFVQERSNMEDGLPYCGTIIGIDGDPTKDETVVYVWDCINNRINWTHAHCVYTTEEGQEAVLDSMAELAKKYNRKLSALNLKAVQTQRIIDKYLREESSYIKQDATIKHLSKMAQAFEEREKYSHEYNNLYSKIEAVYDLAEQMQNFIEE
jgi:hypothetical protein